MRKLLVYAGDMAASQREATRHHLSMQRIVLIGDHNDLRGRTDHPFVLLGQWDAFPYREVHAVLTVLAQLEADRIQLGDSDNERHTRLCLWMVPHRTGQFCVPHQWMPEPHTVSTAPGSLPVEPVPSWWGPGGQRPSPDTALGERDWDLHH